MSVELLVTKWGCQALIWSSNNLPLEVWYFSWIISYGGGREGEEVTEKMDGISKVGVFQEYFTECERGKND